VSIISNQITEKSETQVVSKGLVLNNLIDKKVLKELKEKFKDVGSLNVSAIHFQIIPDQKTPVFKELKNGKNELKIEIKSTDSILLVHPTFEHFKKELSVISSSRNWILRKFLE